MVDNQGCYVSARYGNTLHQVATYTYTGIILKLCILQSGNDQSKNDEMDQNTQKTSTYDHA